MIRDIQRRDVQPAGEVLANAFRGYPFFEYCLGDADNYDRMARGMFASFVRWTMLYGKAWATSDLNAVALRQPPGTRSMGFWNALRSGLVFTFLRMDNATRWRFSRATPIVAETQQSGHGRSTTLALLDDGRTTSSPRHGGRQTIDAVHV
jgi:hypothetical protein